MILPVILADIGMFVQYFVISDKITRVTENVRLCVSQTELEHLISTKITTLMKIVRHTIIVQIAFFLGFWKHTQSSRKCW